MGTVTIHKTYFTEDQIVDGDFPRDDTWTEVHEGVSASEAATILDREGLSFEATGGTWAALPDGSYIVDYADGRRVEVSGHLDGFPERVEAAIIAKVG